MAFEDSQNGPMALAVTEEEAERLAVALVQLLRLPFSLLRDKAPEDILKLLGRVLNEPNVVQRELTVKILRENNREQVEQLTAQISQFLQTPRSILDEIRKEMPKGTPGRSRKLSEEDKPKLALLTRELIPACIALVQLRRGPTRRSVQESLDYLSPDFPGAVQYLREHLLVVERVLSGKSNLKLPRDPGAKATQLAYILAGNAFGLADHYAVRSVRSAIKASTPASTSTDKIIQNFVRQK